MIATLKTSATATSKSATVTVTLKTSATATVKTNAVDARKNVNAKKRNPGSVISGAGATGAGLRPDLEELNFLKEKSRLLESDRFRSDRTKH